MIKLIQIMNEEGILISINVAHIVAIVRKDSEKPLTEILTSCQVAYCVKADYDDICNAVNEMERKTV